MRRAPAVAAASQSSSSRAMLRSFSNIVGSNWTVATLCTCGMTGPAPLDQERFLDRGAQGAFRIHHVAEPDAACLGQHHVGVDLVKAGVGRRPTAEVAGGDPGGVFHLR